MSKSNVNNGNLVTQHTRKGRTSTTSHRSYNLGFETQYKQQIFDYVYSLQKRSLTFLKNEDIIDNAIEVLRNNKGKFVISKLTKAMRVAGIKNASANLHQSTYTQIIANVKTYLDLLKKVDILLEIVNRDASIALEWALLGRSPYLERQLMYRLKVSHEYARNMVHATSRKLQHNIVIPQISEKELTVYLHQFGKHISSKLDENSSKQMRTFANRVKYCVNNANPLIDLVSGYLKTECDWGDLKELAIEFKSRHYLSAIRSFLIYALLQKGTVFKTDNILAEQIVSKPFSSDHVALPRIQLCMGSKFVVYRPGSGEVMTELTLKQGYIDLIFPVKRGHKLVGRAIFNTGILAKIRAGAKIAVLNIYTDFGTSKKVRIRVVLSGAPVKPSNLAMQYQKAIRVSPTPMIGLDINRLGEHMLAFSNRVGLPEEIIELCDSYTSIEDSIAWLQARKSRVSNRSKKYKLKGEINRVYNRRKNILKEIYNKSIHFTAANLIASDAKYLAIEELNISTRGTKGVLAKAILSMPNSLEFYQKACEMASLVLDHDVQLVSIDPRNTSKFHNGCGGVLQRSNGSWDITHCSRCNKRVNTHLNASHNICEKAIIKLVN